MLAIGEGCYAAHALPDAADLQNPGFKGQNGRRHGASDDNAEKQHADIRIALLVTQILRQLIRQRPEHEDHGKGTTDNR